MTNDEIWEWMQRDLDGDLSSGEQQMLYSLLQKDPDLQLKYNRLKHVSEQLEKLPPVVPSFSIVDSILPRLESAASKPAAMSSQNEEILPTLEVKHKSSSPVTSKKWKRTKVWLASIGSTAAACLMIGLLYTGSDGKNHEIVDSNQGAVVAPPIEEEETTGFIGPPAPTPSTNTSQSINAEEEKKPAKQPPAKKHSTKPPANPVTQKQQQDSKPIVNTTDNKPKAPPTPVRQEEKPPAFPIGLKDNPDREEKTSANEKDNDGDKSKSNKNKKQKNDDDDDDNE
ncbi:hypothetical protein [Brevibacillus reuszeri]|uniref:hypothetical protein n=1 Tax=Brevibacillus reuszeri TaxID=54915 RepID=UPI00289820C8|nr:hypothetical protein [Brevibacillus reuszeri]